MPRNPWPDQIGMGGRMLSVQVAGSPRNTQPVRIYLINAVEFDPINSFHLHGNFFDYYNQGTTLTPTMRTVDLITQCQGERGILEFSFAEHEPGLYMFHAHQAEFTELGWMANFDVVEA